MLRSVVSEEHIGQRLDLFVVSKLTDLSRASIQKLQKAGKITVNGQSERSSYKLRHKDVVKIDYEKTTAESIPNINLPILYQDDDCLVINKPLGVLTHSKGAFNPEATVATFVAQHSKKVDGERSGIVHRLDRATSGVMICAKTPEAMSWLQKQFSTRKVKKVYIAKVEGQLEPLEAIIEMPIERNPQRPQTFRVAANGKYAKTYYKVLSTNGESSIVELRPETGRTHQLRVHLKQLKKPIIGDTLYEGAKADRLYLHALSLEITLPSRERKTFTAPLPKEFAV